MGILSIILIILWVVLLFEGIYCFVKGYFHKEAEKIKKHEPNAYRKWVKISGVLLILCSVINIVLGVLDSLSDAADWRYTILCVIVVAVMVAIISISYWIIVKPADKKSGIESEIDKIFNEK